MRKHLTQGFLAAATFAFGISAHAVDITGAGATFPYPIYAKWAEAYKAKTGVGMNYQSIGSGGGIAQIKAKTVDFGASDMPLKPEDLQAAGLTQFPAIIGGVVPIVNLEGVAPGAMRLTGPVLADIYLGKIKTWNDKAIADLNPGLKLPADPITVVRRSDGSGTTLHLDRLPVEGEPGVEAEGRRGHRRAWPEGVGGKGNEGVAAYVQRIKGSIGYVEYAYAKKNKMTYTQVQNKDGQFVAAGRRDVPGGCRVCRLEEARPASTRSHRLSPARPAGRSRAPSFILMHVKQDKPQNAAEVLKFFDWALQERPEDGRPSSTTCRCPTAVIKVIADAWKAQIKDGAGKARLELKIRPRPAGIPGEPA